MRKKILNVFTVMALTGGSASWPAHDPMQGVTREVFLMGTDCSLTYFGQNRAHSVRQIELLVRTLEDTERELSTWQERSALSALNRWPVGVPFALKPGLCRLFQKLQFWVNQTGRAFDPGIGRLLEAWGVRTGGRLPSPSEIREAQLKSGMSSFMLDFSVCRITRITDAAMDCGAFGKGEALDRLFSAVYPSKTDSWLVNLGGQIAVYGIPPGKKPWTVNIAHPRRREKPVMRIHLTSGSIATSGGSERDMALRGRRISHILDPRTGNPAAFSGTVTVFHESALVADILSTALYVMGPDEGLAWAAPRDLAVCYLCPTGDKITVRASRAFNRLLPEH